MAITRPTITKLAPIGVRDGTHRRFQIDRSGEVSLTRKFVIFDSDLYSITKYFLGYSKIAYSNPIDPTSAPSRLERLLPLRDNKDTSFVATGLSLLNEHKFLNPIGANTGIPYNRTTNPAADGGADTRFYKAMIEVKYSRVQY